MRFSCLLAAIGLTLLSAPVSRADVKLPGLISENMVIQQKAPVHLWGWADEGEKVTVRFLGQEAFTTARNGRWAVKLKPVSVAGGPFNLTISGKNTITFSNVLVGEVWVCSGQSNMEWALNRSFEAQKHIAAAANPRIRLLTVPKVRADAPRDDVAANWAECTPQTVADFSAVGYFFGRDLQKALGVPVGLIDSSWGGTPAEAWTRSEIMARNPALRSITDNYRRSLSSYYTASLNFPTVVAKAKAENQPAPAAPRRPWKPGELYNGMIAPLLPYRIQGVIWYQGEGNASRAMQYRTLLSAMIQNWRDDWNIRTFPFLVVQLAPYMAVQPQPGESNWAALREAQLYATKVLPRVGMAVITDVGEENDIHPTKKEPVGARLALAARKIAYGENIVHSGPTYRNMRVQGDKAVLYFDHVGSGLEARGEKLTGFAVAGADGKWVWADAKLNGNTVEVSAPGVSRPVAVRYGWANYPVVNLWNKEGLPATPFRTDEPKGTP